MKFHAALAKALKHHGVTTLFGLIGDANLYLVDRFVADEGGRYVAAAHESGAVLMSYGYARRSGRLGVSTVTHGPAVTNTVTALTEGVRSRTPMLLIAGDTPVADRHNLQKIDQREVIAASGAGFEQVGSAATALADLAQAMRRAFAERRPIALNVPADLMWEEVDYHDDVPVGTAPLHAVRPDLDELDRALGVIASVRRPVVLVGRGVSAAARPAVLRLAERIGAPVATTLAGKGSLSAETFALGICGTLSSDVGTETILAADCIIAFGASLNSFTTAGGSLTKDKAVVHCDSDPASIGRHLTPTAAVIGDAGAIAESMLELIESAEIPSTGFRSPALAERLSEFHDVDHEDLGTDHSVDIRTALRRINTVVPQSRTVVTDGGRFIGQALKLLDVPDPSSLTYSVAFGSIGLGTATAIGAGIAAPDVPVLLVTGDGGFMNGGLTEFNTAVREHVDLTIVVCNDGAYGAEHIQFRNKGMDPSLSMFRWPDFAPVADALGGRGITVRGTQDLEAAEHAIAGRARPLLIDLKLDPDRMPQLDQPGRH